jgi:hypothetical protein
MSRTSPAASGNFSAIHCLRKTNQRHYSGRLLERFDSEYVKRKLIVEGKHHELIRRGDIGLSEVSETVRDFFGAPGLKTLFRKRFLNYVTDLLPLEADVRKANQNAVQTDRATSPEEVRDASQRIVAKLQDLTDDDAEAVADAIETVYAVYSVLTELQVASTVLKEKPEVADMLPEMMRDKCLKLNKAAQPAGRGGAVPGARLLAALDRNNPGAVQSNDSSPPAQRRRR